MRCGVPDPCCPGPFMKIANPAHLHQLKSSHLKQSPSDCDVGDYFLPTTFFQLGNFHGFLPVSYSPPPVVAILEQLGPELAAIAPRPPEWSFIPTSLPGDHGRTVWQRIE